LYKREILQIYFKPGPTTHILHADEGVTILPPDEEKSFWSGVTQLVLQVPLRVWWHINDQLR